MVKKVDQLQKISKISTIILKVLEKSEKNVFGHFGPKIRIFEKKLGKKHEKTRLYFFTTSAVSACTSKFLHFQMVLYMPYIHHKFWSNRINSEKVMSMWQLVS